MDNSPMDGVLDLKNVGAIIGSKKGPWYSKEEAVTLSYTPNPNANPEVRSVTYPTELNIVDVGF